MAAIPITISIIEKLTATSIIYFSPLSGNNAHEPKNSRDIIPPITILPHTGSVTKKLVAKAAATDNFTTSINDLARNALLCRLNGFNILIFSFIWKRV